jgi:hypothetical protein
MSLLHFCWRVKAELPNQAGHPSNFQEEESRVESHQGPPAYIPDTPNALYEDTDFKSTSDLGT